MHKLGQWTNPHVLLGAPTIPTVSLDTGRSRHRRNRESVMSAQTMMEYLQLTTQRKLAEMEKVRAVKEKELSTTLVEKDITNERLQTELTKLRENYLKYVSSDEQSRRHFLSIQEKLNHAAVIEFEYRNKLEIEKLSRLVEEKKYKDQIETVKSALLLAIERAEKSEILYHKAQKSLEESLETKIQSDCTHSGRVIFLVLQTIRRRLQHKALVQWKGLTGYMVAMNASNKKRKEMEDMHQQNIENIKSELISNHTAEINRIVFEHNEEVAKMNSRCSRVAASRDNIFIKEFTSTENILKSYFSKWKSIFIENIANTLTSYKSDIKSCESRLSEKEEEVLKLTDEKAKSDAKLKLCYAHLLLKNMHTIFAKYDKSRMISYFYRWRLDIKSEELVRVKNEIMEQEEQLRELGAQWEEQERGRVEEVAGTAAVKSKYEALTCSYEDLRRKYLKRRCFDFLREEWRATRIEQLTLKLGRFPNLWRLSKLISAEEIDEHFGFSLSRSKQ